MHSLRIWMRIPTAFAALLVRISFTSDRTVRGISCPTWRIHSGIIEQRDLGQFLLADVVRSELSTAVLAGGHGLVRLGDLGHCYLRPNTLVASVPTAEPIRPLSRPRRGPHGRARPG